MTKPNPSKPVSMRDRIRAIIKPGMTIAMLARPLNAPTRTVSKTVSDLRALGEIAYPVPHELRGEALRATMKGSIAVDAALRAGFKRAVDDGMRALIDAAVAAKKVTPCKPGGHVQTFPQGTALYSRVEAA